ncbi:MAG: hypothetical protein K9J13_11915 [Saprospiraceae bacterium]|nr:hypothetical protein [Saprospiraceae bacterium]
MKTQMISKKQISIYVVMMLLSLNIYAQNKPSIAIISMDTKDLDMDNIAVCNMVRLELEKTNVYEVLDKYDVADIIKKNGVDVSNCFGKTQLIKVGNILKTDKMLSGSAEKFGDKIILILRLIDVKAGKIEKTDVMEYLNQQVELQTMISISINNLLGIPNEQILVDLLVNYDRPITSPKTTVKLNGPRMGAAYTFGSTATRMEARKEIGGYNMYPVTSMFGYQYEVQYLSSGDFQALIEFVGAVNGLESGTFAPSLTFLNGFRFNKTGWEIGIGPVFRGIKKANGYYDENGEWNLESQMPEGAAYQIEEEIDYRGVTKLSTGLIIAVGKTIRSGYLNIPLNLYVSPRKEGTVVGLSFGFNVARMPNYKKEGR